ncbi:putative ATP-dependent zinc protease [Adhaeretor mobilis]|uniref:Retropepsin-like aspartic endopeptidase domain-containing protein n=1 Tax=Adhaeretor mobilis TaxID=1930276 RepID=A0A517MZK3_9BACT|nr:RimK/LysX family protein [Adhaeretor mobilis]QDT00295.1 hypothetical protein HG15A2_36310 [Adhaeretor mobilis]
MAAYSKYNDYVRSKIPLLSAAFLILSAGLLLGVGQAKEKAEQETATQEKAEKQEPKKSQKSVIGATAVLTEPETGFELKSRVDTGAKTCSLHVEEWEIEDEVENEDIRKEMKANIGKKIRFRIKSSKGESKWLERKIVDYAIYKTSEKKERRYKIMLKLRWNDLEKEVLLNLNDRSHLEFPLLLGRNYLRGDLVVDVDLDVSERD